MPVDSVETLCQKAKQAISQGHLEHARQFYLQALGLKSDAPDVHFGLATTCFMLNDLDSAAYHFKEVTRIDPLRAGAYINLGAVFNRLEEYDEAVQALRRGIQLNPSRAEGYYNLGLVYRKKGQSGLAVQAYLEATRINPRMIDAHFNLANLYLEMERYNQAVNHYKHVLQLRPNWDKALEGLAIAESQRGSGEHPQPAPAEKKAAEPSRHLKGPDLHKMVDPHLHGNLLTNLHKATIASENEGRQFLEILEHDIEPAIKELSSVLLSPDYTGSDLDRCLRKFEVALENMRAAQRNLHGSIGQVRQLGDRLMQVDVRPLRRTT